MIPTGTIKKDALPLGPGGIATFANVPEDTGVALTGFREGESIEVHNTGPFPLTVYLGDDLYRFADHEDERQAVKFTFAGGKFAATPVG